jgi:DNA-binding GntR family transcriptional regulator
MRQMVVEKVRQAITQGRLTPGQKLVYSDLAKEINVSVTPVREAMKTLEALGLVTIRPYRTAYVSYLTADEIQQIYALRKLLEGLATRLAAECTSQEELSRLRRVLETKSREINVLTSSNDDTVRSNTIVSLQRLHDEFHMSLYAASGDKYLTACEQRNPELAESLMQKHLAQTVAVLLEHIKTSPSQGDAAGNREDEHNVNDIMDTAVYQNPEDLIMNNISPR